MEGNLLVSFKTSINEVLKRIATNSYYRGERVKDESGAHAARMQSGEDNFDVLSDELRLATADVVAIITRNLGRCQVKESSIKKVSVLVGGEKWVLLPEEGDNYTRESDGKIIYLLGDVVVGGNITCRDVEASVVYDGVVLSKGEDLLIFETRAASNFPEELTESVEGAITSYLFDKTLEGWMLINMPAEVNNLAQRSVQDAEKLRQLLVERKKPIR